MNFVGAEKKALVAPLFLCLLFQGALRLFLGGKPTSSSGVTINTKHSSLRWTGLSHVRTWHYGPICRRRRPGCYEKKEEKHKRISLRTIQTLWNNEHARKLAPFPKIFIKAACRGALKASNVRVRYPERDGGLTWVHPFAEMFSIYASMPNESARDNNGRDGDGCYLVSTLDKVMRHRKWRLETLESISLRMRRGIGNETCAKEWVDVEHSHSKPILLRRKTDPLELLVPPQMQVEFFHTPPSPNLAIFPPNYIHRLHGGTEEIILRTQTPKR